MKLTPRTIGALVGGALATGGAVFGYARSEHGEPEPARPVQATISMPPSPAATKDDLAELRRHIDHGFENLGAGQAALNGRVSNIEGYIQAQREARLAR